MPTPRPCWRKINLSMISIYPSQPPSLSIIYISFPLPTSPHLFGHFVKANRVLCMGLILLSFGLACQMVVKTIYKLYIYPRRSAQRSRMKFMYSRMEGGRRGRMSVGAEKEKKKWEEESCFYKGWVFSRSLDRGRHTYVCIIQRTTVQLDGDARK